MIHVKHFRRNARRVSRESLADTKAGKKSVEHMFGVNLTGQPRQCLAAKPEVFGKDLVRLPRRSGLCQKIEGGFNRFLVTKMRNQRRLAGDCLGPLQQLDESSTHPVRRP